MKLSVAVVSSTRQKILISRFTRSELLRKIPSFILEAIETDVNLKMTSCRLSDLKESAYEFTYDIASSYNYDKVGEFFDSLSTLRKRLIALFEFHEIDLAIPAYDFRSVKSQEQNDADFSICRVAAVGKRGRHRSTRTNTQSVCRTLFLPGSKLGKRL